MRDQRSVVYVVDDDPSVLKSLERLLRSEGYDVKTFTSALDFLDFQHPDVPGCLVLDVKMPELGGLELQERLAEKEIAFPIIFITGHGTVPMSVRAMKAGAVDFLEKPFLDKDLLDVVSRAVAADRQAKQEQRELRKLRERLKTLTPREHEVFGLVVTGMLNKQIAYDLGTSEKTIKVHRARIMEKLGAGSLADLVRFAEKLCIRSPEI
ncbi:response regulator transcription factor [Desulforhabdus amnigena]|uniref:response regulator transcription factor n=1 Tax=Desulforhabdus amnigena TaxID=40218 RepID=UPI0024927EF9|nr:response regulator transcription factor [Desulforhabdus amnigena]